MTSDRRTSRVVLLLMGSALLVGVFILSYQSACVFDAKQGYGDYATAQRYNSIADAFLFASIGCFAVGAILGNSRLDMLKAALVIAGIVSVATIALYLLSESGLRGAIECTPV